MSTYDVAVIGGGVIGLSVARELGRSGVERVVVLERDGAVGQQSSARAMGGVRAQFTTPVNIQFSLHSIGEFERLSTEHPDRLTFHQTGYLLMTATETGEALLRDATELQRALGVPTEWLTPDEIVRRAPIVKRAGLRAGTFHARDGFLDPHSVVEVMRLEAGRAGAEIRVGARVGSIRVAPGGDFRLETTTGALSARHVVDAAGAHAGAVGELVGAGVAVFPVRRNLAFVRAPGHPADLIPMCVDIDTGVLVRREVGGGYVIAYSNPTDEPGWDISLDPRFLEQLAERIGNRFPSLEEATIDPRQCWAGLYPETADHHAIVGESAEVERFYVCAGFGGHGIMHSPAAGRAIAELVTSGTCTSFDLSSLRSARFAEDELVVEAAVF